MVKTFRDDKTGEVRPFRGQVTRYYKSDGRWVLLGAVAAGCCCTANQ